MPRARSLFPVALSLESAAKAIKVPTHALREAVYVHRTLPAFRGPNNNITRVIVRDLEDWIRTTWPLATAARKINRRVPDGNP